MHLPKTWWQRQSKITVLLKNNIENDENNIENDENHHWDVTNNKNKYEWISHIQTLIE